VCPELTVAVIALALQRWCPKLADMWRTSDDIQPNFDSVLHNLDTLVGIGHQAGPGIGWNVSINVRTFCLNLGLRVRTCKCCTGLRSVLNSLILVFFAALQKHLQ
jgi:hypothetical protein